MKETERLIAGLKSGDSSAAEALLPLVYDHLRAVAGEYFKGQPRDHTLQPTALVHEAFLKMVRRPDADYADEAHFCAVAAKAMRQVLVNHAEARAAKKRGGGRRRMPMEESICLSNDDESLAHLVALDQALDALAANDQRKARVVEMRFFGGLTMEQIAQVLAVSVSTVESDWRLARAWLSRALEEGRE